MKPGIYSLDDELLTSWEDINENSIPIDEPFKLVLCKENMIAPPIASEYFFDNIEIDTLVVQNRINYSFYNDNIKRLIFEKDADAKKIAPDTISIFNDNPDITVISKTPDIKVENGCVVSVPTKTLIRVLNDAPENLILPPEVESIMFNAFANNTSVKHVEGENVTEIRNSAFMDSNVETFDFPALCKVKEFAFDLSKVRKNEIWLTGDKVYITDGLLYFNNIYISANEIEVPDGIPDSRFEYLLVHGVNNRFFCTSKDIKNELLKHIPSEMIEVLTLDDLVGKLPLTRTNSLLKYFDSIER